MRHKGDSECLVSGDTTDEACGFEKLPYGDFGGRFSSLLGGSEPQRGQFVREALKRGLELEAEFGANPFRYGLLASTDTHLGTPGLVSEREFPGHGGAGAPAGDALPVGLPDALEYGPGGLAVIWAEENTRSALFDALLRREVYGTSGPRPELRLFGGFDLPADLCERSDFVARGYRDGVPMGGIIEGRSDGAEGLRFAVQALQDPGTDTESGAPLQRIQIVKGWLADDGLHEQVRDVAGGPSGATVDLASCERRGSGHTRLCSVWEDPEFDPAVPAFYYARVLENPSCRWSQYVCSAARVDCSDSATVRSGLEGCCDPTHRPTVQERAWSSPIWYQP
jgi:hypothetical protein